MSNNQKIEQMRKQYIYQPNYNDRYIQHLEKLSKENSETNKNNIEIARDTISGIIETKQKNNSIKEFIRYLREEDNDLPLLQLRKSM